MRSLIGLVVCAMCASTSVHAENTPLVLIPGFMGQRPSGVATPYFIGWREAFEEIGVDVHEIGPPPNASSEARGRYVLDAIDRVLADTGAKRVVVITHSQGGVDVRWALQQGGADRIAAVATIAAPHAGTGVADTALRWPRFAVRAALVSAGAMWQFMQGDEVSLANADDALVSMSTAGAARLNALQPEPPVPFFSVAGFTGDDVDGSCRGGKWSRPRDRDEMHPSLSFGTAMIKAAAGDVSHDGVVPTRSMRFGTFLGCVAADHVDWEGWDDHEQLLKFVIELWRGLDDIAQTGDPDAMERRIPRLARLAKALPR
jgi:triacylglycerol lipase